MTDPVAFTLFGMEIRWYGIILATGITLACILAVRTAKKYGYKSEDILDMFLAVIPVSIIFARIWYVIFNLDYYGQDILKMINFREGGLAIQGGLIGGFLTAFIFTRIKKIDLLKLSDVIVPFIPLGQAVGRWGNYTNGEAHGGVTDLPWAIEIDGQRVHPTFLYESICNFIIFIILYNLMGKTKFKGQILYLYMIMYSVIRFFIEELRTDSLMIWGFKTAQITCIVFIAIGIAGIAAGFKNLKKAGDGQ